MTWRMPATALVLVLGLLLGGCTGLPEHSTVQPGLVVDGPDEESVREVPAGPVTGAKPVDIVWGFLRAGIAVSDDVAVPRSFLAPAAEQKWAPDGSAYVYGSTENVSVRLIGPREVAVVAHVVGRMDSDGHYQELPAGSTRSLRLGLEQVSGQWRIASGLPDASVLLSAADFARYDSFPTTYVSARAPILVSDNRYLLKGSGLATRLARAQLAPPPSYLQGAVGTGIPEFTTLVGSVTEDNGVATVTLSERASSTDERQRRAMWAQFAQTLTQLRTVTAVQLEVAGKKLSIAGLPDRPLTVGDLGYTGVALDASVAFLRSGTAVQAVDPASLAVPADPASRDAPTPPVRQIDNHWFMLAAAADRSELAAVGGDLKELSRWRGGRQLRLPHFATELSRPVYDRNGYLWVAGRTAAGTRLFVQPTTTTAPALPTALNVAWLEGRTVTSLKLAADGLRIAVVSVDPKTETSRIDVVGVNRNAAGAPVALSAATAGSTLQIGARVTSVTDLVWVDDQTLGVLGRVGKGQPVRVVLVPLSGPSQDLGQVAGGQAIMSFGGPRSIAVVTDRHEVLVRAGNGFLRQGSGTDLAVPGR
ncbi:LpqB family beta-propeller domain-containing protein [Arsenicicoccus piscis]|uniref:Lipoprotein LpqB n=1 Tax=Arsenicicoccus piscis TaxID=673954 RepID=A0ABQ6HJ52_9MICO|nr:LpqB family beta-propeller domain-containing protein [Arsenicicoccus piscis]MCH8628287.1 LpqB family beta-propeller domain-containing protein [Arsenicicoccus piscis]GMA18546.1 lipoprotein LpqB [Arsenicicoccus piscis]